MDFTFKKIIFIIFIFLNYLLYFKIKIYFIKDDDKNRIQLFNELFKIYSTLYFTAKDGKTIRPSNYNDYIIKNYNHKTKGVCLCTIGKKENLYAREFIEYYKQLGFDKIIIFDNNNLEDEKIEDVLQVYIKANFVTIINARGVESAQIPILNYCYLKYNMLFDWIAFFDFDEFLFINGSKTIKDYIYNIRFQKCQTVLFNWYFYDDNDLEKYENKKVLERFKRPSIKSKGVKSIIRGNLKDIIIPSAHIIGINVKYFCDSNGKRVFPTSFYNINFPKDCLAYIKHFYTKTAEEFCDKISKGDIQFHKNHPNYRTIIQNKIDKFFSLNKITYEKINILEKCLNLSLNKFKIKIN